ncbi:GMC family oxidoreductase [Mycolicibacterium vaccae]|uniref:GMC family oxidoreductase n=1 Tax=Mycolicibacterium vaccae TaxID=1810 RepID=UPI0007DCC053|nr:GMC family oxidoreductase [Mycolicibacterium vaccae]ANI40665.1 2-methyl 1,2 propanediol dehydrogenase [Mycolicibacterium vaccae 95051]
MDEKGEFIVNKSGADDTDVLVIGAGPGGAGVTLELVQAGYKVICLEQGPWVSSTEHPHYHREWEIEKQRGWAYDPNVRGLPEDYPVTGFTTPYLMNNVGGSTMHYAGHWPRYKPVDFRKGTEHGLEGTIDWPISYEELAPYYDKNDAIYGISGTVGDPSYPDRSGVDRDPPVLPGKLGRNFANALGGLGWHWWPSDNAIITRPRENRDADVAAGNELSGSPTGSLSTPAHTHWPFAIALGADLRTFARVEQIHAKNGKATGATYIDTRTGDRHEITAKIVVVAASGIGTPRLLLMSAQKGHPDGLANSNGLVGKYLMHHIFAFCDAWFDKPMEGYKGAFGAPLYSHEFYHTDTDRGFVNGFGMQVARSFGAAFSAMGSHTGYVAPWGADHRNFFNDHFGNHLMVFMFGEDLPVETNCVTLDTDAKDSSGLPAAHVNWEPHANDIALANFGIDRIFDAARALGAVETNDTGVLNPPPGWHLMGTCRMGNNPQDSVTNKWNQTWDIPNLFVVDGSSLTTGGAVNPTSTIGALAVRAGEYISRRFADIVDQKTTPSNADAPAI